MFLKKTKILIYTFICLSVVSLIIPTYSSCIDKNSVYVWSDNLDSISTSSTPTTQDVAESYQNNSR